MPDKPAESEAIAYVRICEEHRTKRIIAALVTLVLLVAILAWAITRILDKPWWEVLVGTIGTVLVGPSGLFWLLNRRFKRYTMLNQSRVAEIEKKSYI